MTRKKTVRFTIPEYKEKKELYRLLGYQEYYVKEKGYKVIVTYQIDTTKEKYREIKKVAKMVDSKGPVFYPIILLMFVSFILLSTFVIILADAIWNGTEFNVLVNCLSFVLPAFVTFLVNAIYAYFYFIINQKIMLYGKVSKEDIEARMKEINNK